jgi:hypothetical protein
MGEVPRACLVAKELQDLGRRADIADAGELAVFGEIRIL